MELTLPLPAQLERIFLQMNTIIRLSSVTKKICQALSGAFLMLFLLIHAGINLFILPVVPNHEEIYRMGVVFMTTNPLIKVIEIVLLLTFAIHILMGILLSIENRLARPVGYKKRNYAEQNSSSRYMMHTGIVLLLFLFLHFCHFYFVKLGFVEPYGNATSSEDFYAMVNYTFSNPVYDIVYMIAMIAIFFHLDHGFQSAFQSLGLNHPTYNKVIGIVGHIDAAIVSLIFFAIPAYYLFFVH